MSEKLLPPAAYLIRVMYVGGADMDGNILFVHLGMPATPARLAEAVREQLQTFVPKRLERIVAGSWLYIALDYAPGTLQACCLGDQVAVDVDIERGAFLEQLGAAVPQVVELLVGAMLDQVGIEPITVHAAAERPALLN